MSLFTYVPTVLTVCSFVLKIDVCLFHVVVDFGEVWAPCAGGKIEKNKMGWACGAYGAGERGAHGSGGET